MDSVGLGAMRGRLEAVLSEGCQRRPDGTWLVDAPVVRSKEAPAFLLPNGGTKDAFVRSAADFAALHMAAQSLNMNVVMLGMAVLGAFHSLELTDRPWLFTVAVPALLALQILVFKTEGRGERDLLAWLRENGREAPAETAPERRGRGWWARRLRRCRPAWMAAVEVAGVCLISVSAVAGIVGGRRECRTALGEWWGAGPSLAVVPGECAGWPLGLAAALVAFGCAILAFSNRCRLRARLGRA